MAFPTHQSFVGVSSMTFAVSLMLVSITNGFSTHLANTNHRIASTQVACGSLSRHSQFTTLTQLQSISDGSEGSRSNGMLEPPQQQAALTIDSKASQTSETTEHILLQAKYERDNGIVQKYGETIKHDGLDGVRAMVWGVFNLSNYVFPVLGVMLCLSLGLQLSGYGFFIDEHSGYILFDTLANIQRTAAMEQSLL